MRSWLPSGLLSSRAQNPCPRTPACQRKPGARKTKGGAPEGGPFSRRGAPPSGAIARCQPCRARRPKQFRRGLCASAWVPKACRAVLLWSPRFLLFARQLQPMDRGYYHPSSCQLLARSIHPDKAVKAVARALPHGSDDGPHERGTRLAGNAGHRSSGPRCMAEGLLSPPRDHSPFLSADLAPASRAHAL